MNYYINSEHLSHHGIKGQKWGVRRFQNEDGSYKPGAEGRYSEDLKRNYKIAKQNARAKYDKSVSRYLDKDYPPGSEKAVKDYDDIYNKYMSDLKSARKDYKNAKNSKKIEVVKEYNKKFNAAEKASNAAYEKRLEYQEQYKNLGKTRLQRIVRAASGKSDAAKEYSKTYDQASEMYDDADRKWKEAKEAYKATGKTAVSRVINNIMYDPARLKYKSDKEKAKNEWKAAAEKYGSTNTKEANDAYDKAADKYISDMKKARQKRLNS